MKRWRARRAERGQEKPDAQHTPASGSSAHDERARIAAEQVTRRAALQLMLKHAGSPLGIAATTVVLYFAGLGHSHTFLALLGVEREADGLDLNYVLSSTVLPLLPTLLSVGVALRYGVEVQEQTRRQFLFANHSLGVLAVLLWAIGWPALAIAVAGIYLLLSLLGVSIPGAALSGTARAWWPKWLKATDSVSNPALFRMLAVGIAICLLNVFGLYTAQVRADRIWTPTSRHASRCIVFGWKDEDGSDTATVDSERGTTAYLLLFQDDAKFYVSPLPSVQPPSPAKLTEGSATLQPASPVVPRSWLPFKRADHSRGDVMVVPLDSVRTVMLKSDIDGLCTKTGGVQAASSAIPAASGIVIAAPPRAGRSPVPTPSNPADADGTPRDGTAEQHPGGAKDDAAASPEEEEAPSSRAP